VVDLAVGALVATAAHPTTVDTDVLHGLDSAIAVAAAQLDPGTDLSTVYTCSSAGGGLRLAVVGYEALVTAEAGHRVGLSAGARVVHVAAGRLDGTGAAALRAARPDVVLLVGGTDGGDAEVLTHNAARLAESGCLSDGTCGVGQARLPGRVPVVLAGNVAARETARQALAAKGVPVIEAENVLPRIGVLNPRPARLAIREVFLRHVIGGKKLSEGSRFASLVRGATPDLVLAGVELLADHTPGDLLVVDVGGATTDVYSALDTEEHADPQVAGALWRSRTVEGDLGMRWNAPGVVSAAAVEGLLAPGEEPALAAAATARATDPGFLATSAEDREVDQRLATLAATVALRRHARGERPGRHGKDLQGVRLVIGSGGVLRHAEAGAPVAVLDAVVHDHAGGWPLPRRPRTVVDAHNVLAAAGLLAAAHPAAALGLLRRYLCTV
jgi:uncharacterized protein (TIGR01319 family)